MSLVCGIFAAPIAAGLATYFSAKEYPEQNQTRSSVKVGFRVGSISTLGGILGTLTALFLFSLAVLTFNAQNRPTLEELFTVVASGGLSSGVVSVILISIVVIGLCVVVAAITGKVISNRHSSSKSVTV